MLCWYLPQADERSGGWSSHCATATAAHDSRRPGKADNGRVAGTLTPLRQCSGVLRDRSSLTHARSRATATTAQDSGRPRKRETPLGRPTQLNHPGRPAVVGPAAGGSGLHTTRSLIVSTAP